MKVALAAAYIVIVLAVLLACGLWLLGFMWRYALIRLP